jgi:hypothetical protein
MPSHAIARRTHGRRERVSMSSEIKVYKIKDFIRQNEKGDIDLDRSMQIVRELAAAASLHPGHNILIDMRDTTIVGDGDMGYVFQVALEVVRFASVLKGKIANVVPDDEKRLSIARTLKAAMDVQGFTYEIFTDFEAAMNWLSEVTEV